MLVFCYWLTVWCADGMHVRKLVALCSGATLLILAIGVSGILVGPYWFDVIYPTMAVWLLLPILVSIRRALPAALSTGDSPRAGQSFHEDRVTAVTPHV
jgi:hypothetical protein